jgi:tetratricopeptide (TPR) repeat protein
MKIISTMVLLCLSFVSIAASSPDAFTSMIDEGNKLWSENKAEAAEAAYKKAIQENPESDIGYSRLGAILLMQNRISDAVDAYQSAINKSPKNARHFTSLSIAYLHLGFHDMALAMANRAKELNPGLKHAEDISKYIDAKVDVLAKAQTADSKAAMPHGDVTTPHGNATESPDSKAEKPKLKLEAFPN